MSDRKGRIEEERLTERRASTGVSFPGAFSLGVVAIVIIIIILLLLLPLLSY